MESDSNIKNILDNGNSRDFRDLVYRLFTYRANEKNLTKCRVIKNEIIQGKSIKHIIDVYVEFWYMNNLERTIIKIIDGKDVTKEDVWNFYNMLNDLRFYPKGVLYYNKGISGSAKKLADKRRIDVIHFDLSNENNKNVKSKFEEILPDCRVIGDPFWTIMQVDPKTKKNTGSFYLNDSIFLFTSKKAAEYYLTLIGNKSEFGVFGLTQSHLLDMINILESQGDLRYLNINYSSNQTIQKDTIFTARVDLEKIKDRYVRI